MEARPRGGRGSAGRGSRRLGQHFLADPNLLDAIVREAGAGAEDVVLEVGGGEGALTERLADRVAHLHVIELDERLRGSLEPIATERRNVSLVFGDAMRVDLGELRPPPGMLVSNLPYSIATPLILRTLAELPDVRSWTVLVQREIADRLRASPGTRLYGAPSVLVQLACDVKLLRAVDRAVFVPRPRVDSALLRLRRVGSAAPPGLRRLVAAAFSHRRKALPRSLELAGLATRRRATAALTAAGLDPAVRAEMLSPDQFATLDQELSR